ncbi:MAG: glycerophosphodiester phosphodiesterase [Gammaproteobacteria bacterium]|nr:glycerophosphodiester phosphodiesterase [Gammaproteobacteria bacterium]
MADTPQLVAHRGYASRYPENTMVAMEAAIAAGARYIECDIQFSQDRVALLFHDERLQRTTGQSGSILTTPFAKIRQLDACESSRLGDAFNAIPVPQLNDLIALLQRHPDVIAFVELKEETLNHFGIELVVDQVVEQLQPVIKQCVLISFNAQAMVYARHTPTPCTSIGWAIHHWNDDAHATAQQLRPDYLFCNYQKLPPEPQPLWKGPWRWALYEVTDAALALKLFQRGAELIETMAVGELADALARHQQLR